MPVDSNEIDQRSENGLTDKQLRFCHEYIIDFDKAAAARRAGYSKNLSSSAVQGAENYKKPHVKAKILELLRGRRAEYSVNDERLQTELARIAFADVRHILAALEGHEDLTLQVIKRLPPKVTACIKSIEPTKFGYKLVLHDKLDALDKLAKHLGYYEADNKQKAAEGPHIYLPSNGREQTEVPADIPLALDRDPKEDREGEGFI